MGSQRKLNNFITFLGWSFDVITVLISLTDVFSDLLVARQFLIDGQTLWGWLVLGFFINSNFMYSGALTYGIRKEFPSMKKWSRPFIYFLVFPVAQLSPTLSWMYFMIYKKFCKTKKKKKSSCCHSFCCCCCSSDGENETLYTKKVCNYGSEDGKNDKYQPLEDAPSPLLLSSASSDEEEKDDNEEEEEEEEEGGKKDTLKPSSSSFHANINNSSNLGGRAPRVVADQEAEIATNATMMKRLHRAVESQFVTHGMLFLEAVVEAVPQSIVQLLAITFLGNPSGLQVFSMATSLFSVVSKAYFVSFSCDIWVVVGKILFIAHDVFGLFYVFSSVLSKEAPKEVGVFFAPGSIQLTWVSYIWLLKFMGLAVYMAVSFLGLGFFIFCDQWVRGQLNQKELLAGFFRYTAVVLGFFPGMLALEGGKLSWLVFFLTDMEPTKEYAQLSALLFAFLRLQDDDDQGSMEEEAARLKLSVVCNDDEQQKMKTGERKGQKQKRRGASFYWAKRMAYLYVKGYYQCEQVYQKVLEEQRRHPIDWRFLYPEKHAEIWSYVTNVIIRPYLYYTRRCDPLGELQVERGRGKEDKSSKQNKAPAPGAAHLLQDERSPILINPSLHPERVNATIDCTTDDKKKEEEKEEEKESMEYDSIDDGQLPRYFKIDLTMQEAEVAKNASIATQKVLRHISSPSGKNSSRQSYDSVLMYLFSHRHLIDGNGNLWARGAPAEIKRWFTIIFNKDRAFDERLGSFTCAVGTILITLSSLFSLAYPFINFAMYYETQNLLQRFCFYALCGSLLLAAPLLPHILRWYVPFCLEVDYLRWAMRTSDYTTDTDAKMKILKKWIADYYLPRDDSLLLYSIPSELIPADIVGVLASFLAPGNIRTDTLTKAECAAAKKMGSP